MNEEQVLKIVGAIAEGTPIVLEMVMHAIEAFKSKGEIDKAKRLEDILPIKSESRAMQEQLESG